MKTRFPFSELNAAISISNSPDLHALGLSRLHLEDAMTEIARHLLALGARLSYGGDLRPFGFTEQLIELVIRHQSNSEEFAPTARVTNYLAWPVHAFSERSVWGDDWIRRSRPIDIVCLTLDGKRTEFGGKRKDHNSRKEVPNPRASPTDWREGLTSMRRTMLSESDVRIVLGGQVEGYRGVMPGIAEEALLSLKSQQPLFLLGGFGGCARDIAESLGLIDPWGSQTRNWDGRSSFAQFGEAGLMNGLSIEENKILSRTPHIDQAIPLILKGMMRVTKKPRADFN